MTVRSTEEADDLSGKKLACSLHRTAVEVIDEASGMLVARDRERQRLRESIAEGFAAIERGEGVELTPESMAERGRRASERAARGEQPSLDVCP